MRMLWAIASLTCVWSLCGPLGAQPNEAPNPVWRKPIKGFGDSEEAARKDALHKAKDMVEGVRAALHPLVKTSDLTENDIRNRFLVDGGSAGEDLKLNDVDHAFKQWIVTLKPETERMLRADERETISYLAILGLSVVLLAGFGYIRLDEYTQRKYTTWLRLAGVGVVATAVAGWWTFAR